MLQEVYQRDQQLNLDRLQYRKWQDGDAYAPHDLSSVEQRKWQRRKRPEMDAFDVLSMNPLEQFKVIGRSLARERS